jgi:hypothetical protein
VAHKITKWAEFLEIEHFGAVSYLDRLAALDAIAEASALSGPLPLLINLTEAFLTDDLQTDNRVDYMDTRAACRFRRTSTATKSSATSSSMGGKWRWRASRKLKRGPR